MTGLDNLASVLADDDMKATENPHSLNITYPNCVLDQISAG